MDVALSKDHEVLALELDLELVFRVEQDLVPYLDGPDMGADGHRLGPRQPSCHLCGRRDQDARARASLTLLVAHLDQHAIEQDGDRKAILTCGDLSACHAVTVPQTLVAPAHSCRTDGEAVVSHVRLCLSYRVLAEVEDRRCEHGIGATEHHAVDQILEGPHAT